MMRRLRVLHLEDSSRDAEIVRHRLEMDGIPCDIHLAIGQAGFELALARESFDIIISDYNLPGYDGITALKQAQTAQPDVPVILVSGLVSEEQAVKCLHIGATDYLFKERLDRLAPAVQRAIVEAETRLTRKRAEVALAQSEQRKAAILESVLDCIITMDADGSVIEFNAAAERTFGYTKVQAIGRTLDELIIPTALRAAHTAGLARFLTTDHGPLLGEVVEVTAVRSDGSELPVEMAITVIRSEKAPIFTGVLRDITARKRADETRTRLAAIVNSSDDAIFAMAMDGTILTWNTGAERLYGYTASDMIGRSRTLLVPAGGSGDCVTIWDHAARGEAGEPCEMQQMRKDGSIIDISLTISPMMDATSSVTSVSAIARDITSRKHDETELKRLNDELQLQRLREVEVARKRAEDLERQVVERQEADAAVRVERDRAQQFLDTADVTLLALNVQGRITLINRSGCDLLGWTEQELLGCDFVEACVPAKSRADTRRRFVDTLAGPDSSIVDGAIVTKSGEERMVEWRNTLLRNHEGDVVSTLSCGTDLTIRRRLDEERVRTADLERRGIEAQQANRLKSEFLANMSHELRTPLNAIIGFTALMQKGMVGPVSEIQRTYLGDVLTSSRHLLQLINDVLDLAKVESGKIDLRPEPIDLAQVVNEVRDVLRGLAAIKQLRIETQVDPEVTAAVLDPSRVKQILYNFLSNAIKFTPDGGHVEVLIAPDGPDHLRIDVSDSGPGIAAEGLQTLFVEFQQLDAPGSKKHEGTGLGLSLTKRLVEAHGGRVTAQSTVGRGSIFSAILPRRMMAEAPGEVRPVIGPPHGDRMLPRGTPTESILIVDDNPQNLELARLILCDRGYHVKTAIDAEDALRVLQSFAPRLILMDVQLPGMNGLDLTRRLKADPTRRGIVIIAVTAYAMKDDEEKVFAAGCDGYLTKPIDIDVLPRVVAEHLARAGRNREAQVESDLHSEAVPGRREGS